MTDFVLKELSTNQIESELKLIGFDEGYRFSASGKYKYKNLKIFGLTPAQANILKQTALSFGADCATHRETITGNVDKTDVILGGSYSQLEKISLQLKKQPFSLGKLGEEIISFLKQKKNKTKLIGILNVTPDSFSDGISGEYAVDKYIEHFLKLIDDGADIIDIGAESTRPGFTPVDDEAQIKRLGPVLEFICKKNIGVTISVDTRSSVVAEYALQNGAKIINDVSGFDNDKKIADIISKYKAGVIIQSSRDVKNCENFIDKIYFELKEKIEYAKSKEINNIIIDLGICFGKTKEQNFELLKRFKEFESLNCPIMLGISRKSLLGLEHSNDNYLKDSLTAAVSYPLMQSEIDYLRVHNVKLHKHLLNLL